MLFIDGFQLFGTDVCSFQSADKAGMNFQFTWIKPHRIIIFRYVKLLVDLEKNKHTIYGAIVASFKTTLLRI